MKDLHGLGDHGTGVDLSVDAHYEGLVQQDVCVFCRRGEKGSRPDVLRKARTTREVLTLTEQNVFRQVPEGRLHHVEVPAAHAVHEGGQEVCGQAAGERAPTVTLHGGGGATSWAGPYLGLFWMQRSARLKAMFRHSSSDDAMSLCRSLCKQAHRH